MADKAMNIYQKMAMITAELATVGKNLTVSTGKSGSYKAVSERDIIDAVKPLESKYGVYSYPAERVIVESQLLESESTYNGNTTKRTTFFERVQTKYRFVNIDDPTDFIETTTFAEGLDSGDKASGKAMTYGDKYALMKAYKISTGDDPDEKASVDTHYSKLATDADKESFKKLCGAAGLKPSTVLMQAGWQQGQDVTKTIMQKALQIVMEKGNANNG